MILSVRHTGLSQLYARMKDKARGASKAWLRLKGARILARLDIAREPRHMDLPGWRLYPLKGRMEGAWSVCVTGHWCIVFRFTGEEEDKHVADVDLVDFLKQRRRLKYAYEEPAASRSICATRLPGPLEVF
jgi:proteic killer suppression protein